MIFSLKIAKNARIMNLMIAIQLAIVFALIIMMMSAIEDRTVYYSQFEEALSQNGICIIPAVASDTLKSEEDILEHFDKATKVTGGKANMILIDSDIGNAVSGFMTYYSEQIMEDLPPYLKEGTLPDKNSEIPQCLACDNFGYKVGDVLDFTDWDGNSFKVQICGIMSDNQNIYGTGGPSIYDYVGDYRDFYYQLSSSIRPYPLFLSTEEIMEKAGSSGRYDFYSLTVVNFPEDAYTEKELENMASELNFSYVSNTEKYFDKSESYVNQELYTFLPIALSILIITLFTAIITTVVTTMQNLKSYAVLYLSGATWRMCSVINFINYITIVIFTAIADTVFFVIGSRTFLKETVVKASLENIGVCGIILVLFLLLSLAVPLLVVRNKQPRDVLKTEFRH
jgi:hypothetical protein